MRGNMKAERARIGLSARDVADAIGVSANQVSRWELGVQEPSSSNLLKLSSLYKCSPEYLLDLTDDKKLQVIAQIHD